MGCTYHFLKKKKKLWQLWWCHCRKCEEKKIVCGNGIAEIGGINFWQLWQSHCRKWGKKKRLWNMWKSKKKSCHIHNIFTTFLQYCKNCVNISFLKKIKNKKVKCGNSIAEIGGKFFFPSYFGNAIATFHFFFILFFSRNDMCTPFL